MNLRALFHDRSGVGAMELGIALPFLLLVGLGMLDASRMIAAKIDYEQIAQRTTDLALARRPNGTDTAYLKAEATSDDAIDEEDVTITIYLECDGERKDDFDAGCDPSEVASRYVDVEIARDLETQFDWGGLASVIGFSAFDSTVTVRGDSLVRFQ